MICMFVGLHGIMLCCVSETDGSGVLLQGGLGLLVALGRRVKQDKLASLDSKAYQAHKEMPEHQEIPAHKARMDNQDPRVQLVSLVTQVSLVRLDGPAHQDPKDSLARLDH